MVKGCFVNDKKQYWRNIVARFLAVGLAILILVFNISPIYAASWTVYFPIGITDTSGAARTNVPVLLGVTGSALQTGGFINTSGTNTNCQIGASSIPYTMGTTQIGVLLSSVPAYSTQQVDLYCGYSPNQTAFPIILGNNGYFTTSSSTDLDIGNSGNYIFSGWFNPTSTGYLLNNPNSAIVQGNGSGNVTFTTYTTGTGGTTFPVISATNNGGGTAANATINLPAGYVASDLLFIYLSTYLGGGANYTITPPSGWTVLYNNPVSLGAYLCNSVYYKVANGTEGANVTANFSTTLNWAYSTLRIDKNTYIGTPAIGTATTGSLTNPDPPNLTSGFGAVDTLWLATCYATAAQASVPANYTTISSSSNTSCYNYVAYRNRTIATEDPGTFGTATYWMANTVAIKGLGTVAVTSNIISATNHVIQCYISANTIGIKVDSGVAVTAAFTGSIPTSTATATWMSSNIFAYADYISVYVGANQTILYQPVAMISSTTLPDRAGTALNGTITWGTNSGISISYGAVVSYSPTSSNASSSSGNFSPPALSIGSSWYGTGNVASSGFWDIFSGMSTTAGFDGKTILMFVAIGVAMILGMLVFRSSGSVLISVVLIGGILYFFSEMSIIPFALVFIFLLISAGIMYLVRLI